MPEPEPWRGPSPSPLGPRDCSKCGRTIQLRPQAGPWTPLRSGWRCPDCTIAYIKEIGREARGMLRAGDSSWIGHAKHDEFEECRHCDVIRAAERMLAEPWP